MACHAFCARAQFLVRQLVNDSVFMNEFHQNCVTYTSTLPVECVAGDYIGCSSTPDGRGYVGHISVTVSGKQCQAWTSQSPHTHGYTDDDMFPDVSVNDASNYCRNPTDDWDDGVWCYTTDPATEWEACIVPDCEPL